MDNKTTMSHFKLRRFAFLVCLSSTLLFVSLSSCSTQSTRAPEIDTAKMDHLLQLINARLAMSRMVARAKWNSGAPLDDPEREQEILEYASNEAASVGIPEAMARDFFQDQFNAGKLLQRRLHEEWQRTGQQSFTYAPDLYNDMRPVLDRLTAQLIAALHDVQPMVLSEQGKHYMVTRCEQLVRNDFDGAPRAVALHSLLHK